MTEQESFKAGALLLITEGVCSDYGVVGLCRAARDFDTSAVLSEFKKWREPQIVAYRENRGPWISFSNSFISWLILNGYAEEVEYEEWWADE